MRSAIISVAAARAELIRPPRAYLAGPEVFLPDAIEVLAAKAGIARAAGLDPLTPLDKEMPPAPNPRAKGIAIAEANEALIRHSDLVIANLIPFRGPSADAGTVYEVGYARGLGLPIFGYTNDPREYRDRARLLGLTRAEPNLLKPSGQEHEPRDAEGLAVEDFGLTDNLMIEGAILASGGAMVLVPAPPSDRFRDLLAFAAACERASRAMRSGPR